jgi:hypothetical protein
MHQNIAVSYDPDEDNALDSAVAKLVSKEVQTNLIVEQELADWQFHQTLCHV